MLPLAVVSARLAQFACAMILLGSPLFYLYGLPLHGPVAAERLRWPRPLLLGAAFVLFLAAGVSLCAQTAVMSDSAADALKPDVLASVLTGSQFGLGIGVRLGLAILICPVLVFAKPSRGLWLVTSVVGVGIVASFAWTGHGAADEGLPGWMHLMSDILHLLAAAVWLGTLAAFSILLLQSKKTARPEELSARHLALRGFSGIGSGIVAVLLATGLVNSWFLIGPSHVTEIVRTPYGQLLIVKVTLFTVMLGLAASNRFYLTPRLGAALGGRAPTESAVTALRRSVVLETLVAGLVLVLVSVLGTLAPPSSQ